MNWAPRNLLLNGNHELHNRELHICGHWASQSVNIDAESVNIEPDDVNIRLEKLMDKKLDGIKTKAYALRLYQGVSNGFFGRTQVMAVLDIKNTYASALIKKLHEAGIIEPVSGQGKGKYRFISF